MKKLFTPPRSGKDLASAVLGKHEDCDISIIMIESSLRRARAHLNLIVGSLTNESQKEEILRNTLLKFIQGCETGELTFDKLVDFDTALRKQITAFVINEMQQ